MSSDYRIMWEAAGGSTPAHWNFIAIEKLLETPKSITVGVMYPGSDTVGGTPLVRVSDVKNGAIASQPDFRISSEVDEEYKRTKLNGTELLVTLVGNPGDCVVVTSNMSGWNVARALAVIRLADVELRPWIRYVLLSKPAKHLIDARLNTTVQKTLNLKDIKELGIPIPPREERIKITNAIDAIEAKCLVNRQTNQTLEQIAQALFKSWFVDFEPTRAKIAAKKAGASPEEIERAAMCAISGKTPDQLAQLPPETQQTLKTTAVLFPDALVESELGEVPEGWEIRTLGDLMSFNPQRTLKKGILAPYLDMKNVPTEGHLADDVYLREMASGMKFINGDTLLARITPCLENGKTAYVDFLEEGQVGWGSTEFIVMRPKEGRPLSLGYIIARLEVFRLKAIQTMTGSSGRQRADANVLSQQPWIDYPIDLLRKFDLTSGHFLAIAKNNGEQNKALSELRDSLLPKLLSGEIQLQNSEETSNV